MEDKFIEDIVSAIQPPEDDSILIKSHTRAVFGTLAGAAVSLVKCKELIDNYIQNYDDPARISWTEKEFSKDLENLQIQMNQNNDLNWEISPSFCAWSIGFFINNAEHRIASALDKCTNAWLGLKLGINFDQPTGEEEWLLHATVSARLRVIAHLIKDPKTRDKINDLVKIFGIYSDTKEAEAYIKIILEKFDSGSIDKLYGQLAENPAMYAAIIFGCFNSFKHQVKGLLQRSGRQHLIEWVVATKALLWVTEYWKAMLSDTIYTDEETPSQ